MRNSTLKRYLVIGATAYLIEMATLFLFHRVLGLSSLKAVAISFWVGLVVAFVLQKFITFQNFERQRQVVTRQAIGYGLLVGWNYVFTLAVVKLFLGHQSVFLARTAAILTITLWNFFVYKKLFRSSSTEHHAKEKNDD